MSIPDALHAPSGRPAASNASNPPRHGDPSAPVTLQSELRRLTDARKNIDAQLEAYFDVLKSVEPRPAHLLLRPFKGCLPLTHSDS